MKIKLYDEYAIWGKDGVIWLYSDPHFSDPEMRYLRKNYIGDEEQVKRINSKVGKKDTIIFLGDIGNTEFVKKIRGRKILICGNHDAGVSNYKRKIDKIANNSTICPICQNSVKYDLQTLYNCGPEYAWCPTCRDTVKPLPDKYTDNHLFDQVYEGPLFISEKILLSHEPVNLPYVINIHGHEHGGAFIVEHSANLCAEIINYTPVRLDSIIQLIGLNKVDSIHRVTIDKATERKKNKIK